jgi:hypothetical protein
VAFLFPGLEPEFIPRTDGVAEALGLSEAPAIHHEDTVLATPWT